LPVRARWRHRFLLPLWEEVARACGSEVGCLRTRHINPKLRLARRAERDPTSVRPTPDTSSRKGRRTPADHRIKVRLRPIADIAAPCTMLRMMRLWRPKRQASQSPLKPLEEEPSSRLVDQRVRNRIMEEILTLSEGDPGVAECGPTEWFELFFDWFPYEGEDSYYPAMTEEEVDAVRNVLKLMQQAISDPGIPKRPTVDAVIRSGWPRRIAPVAKQALDLMLQRGRFSEDVEEEEPSTPIPWPSR
jgi:hypothetical protein